MTVVHEYFRNVANQPSDVQLIRGAAPSDCYWDEMAKSDKVQAKEANDGGPVSPATSKTHHLAEGLGKMHIQSLLEKKSSCGVACIKILFCVIAVIVISKAIGVIALSVLSAIASRVYSVEQSGRMVSMIVVAVTAAVSLSVAIYAVVAIWTKKNKALHAASITMLVLALIQAVLAGLAVRVTAEDEASLGRLMVESFKLAEQDNPAHVKLWASTQNDLNCCGVYSAEDYRSSRLPIYFPPDVPISCCPTYDPDRSALVQERERENCKARKTFYDIGCKNLAIDAFKEYNVGLMIVVISLIVFELLLAIVGFILSNENKKKQPNPEGGDKPK